MSSERDWNRGVEDQNVRSSRRGSACASKADNLRVVLGVGHSSDGMAVRGGIRGDVNQVAGGVRVWGESGDGLDSVYLLETLVLLVAPSNPPRLDARPSAGTVRRASCKSPYSSWLGVPLAPFIVGRRSFRDCAWLSRPERVAQPPESGGRGGRLW